MGRLKETDGSRANTLASFTIIDVMLSMEMLLLIDVHPYAHLQNSSFSLETTASKCNSQIRFI